MTDQEIINLLKDGRYDKAMKTLYKSFPVLKKWVLKNSGTKADAEDVFQDVLLVLCKKIKESDFQLTSTLATYMTGIGKNLWLSQLRKRKITPSNIEGEELELVDHSLNESEQVFTLAEQAFALLGEKCKELLIMFYHKKESMSAIATKLGFSTDRVAKNQKYRCLEKAKENYIQLKQA